MSTAFQVFHLPRGVAISSNLTLIAGARVRFFLTTTTDPTPVYQDSGLTTPHTQPVVADSAGRLPTVYLDPSIIYKATFTDSADVELYPAVDPVNDQLLSQAVIGGFLYPRTAAEIAAGVTPVNYAYPERYLLRYSGIVADGATDCTTAVLAVINAMGGRFVLPYNVIVDIKTLLQGATARWVIDDESLINDYNAVGETAKSVGIIASDVSANDSALRIVSGHHPGLTLNNFRTAGTSSATNGVISIDYAYGQHRNEGVTKRGARFGQSLTMTKDGAVWSYQLLSYAPQAAITAEWENWITGEAIAGAGVYRANADKHYFSTGAGTTGATGPTHTTGTVSDGGVSWTFADFFQRNVYRIDQNGRTLYGSGAFTYQWNYIGCEQDADGGQVAVNWQASGVSKKVIQRWTPTTAGGTASAVPIMEAQDAVGLRFFNSAKTRELLRLTETDTRFPDTQVAFAVSATAPDVADSGTIATANVTVARVQPSANRTGVILEAGTVAGQKCFVENNANFTITFAAAATSNVANGVTSPIPAFSGRHFMWSAGAARWFPAL